MRRLVLKTLAAGAVLLLTTAHATTLPLDGNRLIAHRGESVDEPENTVPAIRKALEQGFAIEIDVYLANDDVIFLSHDWNAARFKWKIGIEKDPTNFLWKGELELADAGKWKGEKWKGVPYAQLDDVLALVPPGRRVIVDVKDPRWERIFPLMRAAFDRHPQIRNEDLVFFTGGTYLDRYFKGCKHLYCTIPRKGWADDSEPLDRAVLLERLRKSRAEGISVRWDAKLVTADYVRFFKDAGYEFHIWTERDPVAPAPAFVYGVDSVTCDSPRRLLEAIRDDFHFVGEMNATCAGLLFAETEGWNNIDPKRRPVDPGKVLWTADLKGWPENFKVELCEGAEGKVTILDHAGVRTLGITKTNDKGWIVITPKAPIKVPAGTELQAYAYVSGERNDPEYSLGFLRMWGKKRSLAYFGALDGRGSGGPKMDMLVNTAPGMSERKLCRFLADDTSGTSITPAIVIAGPRSDSVWQNWGIEDLAVSKKNWQKFIRTVEPPDHSGDRQDAESFAAALAADRDHTAQIERRDGHSVLLIDGVETPPVFFKGKIPEIGTKKNLYCGKKMEQNGIKVQVLSVRFGDSPRSHGWWTKDGFDVQGAANEVRDAMRMAPGSVFILTAIVDAYPEFTAEHPDEIWIAPNGQAVWGNQTHANYSFDRSKYHSKHWPWVSYSSKLWREEAKRHLTDLIRELKRQGLAKRIVGFHIGGYHDHQFATRHADFSKPAVKGFRDWQLRQYGKVRWEGRPTYDKAVIFFKPGRDDHQIAYFRYLKTVPMEVMDDFARTFKQEIGKPVIAIRWCMAAFGGDYGAAFDITPFLNSSVIDAIAPQADYRRRTPALAIGARHPTASYSLHGKLMISEFDFRTYGAVSSSETELRVTGLSQALDDAMWRSTYRKCAGQQLAQRMGWWFYDMAGGWFEPDGIAEDIADSMKVIRRLCVERSTAPSPATTAFVIDEEGMFLRNMVSHYYNLDLEMLVAAQMQVLAGSGVPYDIYLAEDLLREPSLVKKYRTVVFADMFAIGQRHRKLLDVLKSEGCTLVFLSGTGAADGVDATGFEIVQKESPQAHGVSAEKGVSDVMLSLCDQEAKRRYLGDKLGAYWQPRRISVVEKAEVRVLARYDADGAPAVAEIDGKGWKSVYVCDPGGLSPQYLNRLVRESGGYAPAAYGLQVDMNADFLSLHCVIPGHYDFKLPGTRVVTNLKTGREVPTDGNVLPLDLVAGETRWYGLRMP